jgi:beta-galactosidase beta subunit
LNKNNGDLYRRYFDIQLVISGNSRLDCCHQKQPDLRQHRLKQLPGAAGAWIVSAQFF